MPVHWSSRQVLSAIARFHQLPFAQTTLGHASRPVEKFFRRKLWTSPVSAGGLVQELDFFRISFTGETLSRSQA
jgi:hypothetical protein